MSATYFNFYKLYTQCFPHQIFVPHFVVQVIKGTPYIRVQVQLVQVCTRIVISKFTFRIFHIIIIIIIIIVCVCVERLQATQDALCPQL